MTRDGQLTSAKNVYSDMTADAFVWRSTRRPSRRRKQTGPRTALQTGHRRVTTGRGPRVVGENVSARENECIRSIVCGLKLAAAGVSLVAWLLLFASDGSPARRRPGCRFQAPAAADGDKPAAPAATRPDEAERKKVIDSPAMARHAIRAERMAIDSAGLYTQSIAEGEERI